MNNNGINWIKLKMGRITIQKLLSVSKIKIVLVVNHFYYIQMSVSEKKRLQWSDEVNKT